MITKFITAVIFVAFVAGLENTRGFTRTLITNKVYQKEGNSPPKQELLVSLVPEPRDQRSTHSYHTEGKNRPSTGRYQQTANVHLSEITRTGQHEPVTSNKQPKSDQHQQITDQHKQITDQHQQITDIHKQITDQHKQITDQHKQITDQHRPTSERFQTTMGYLHKTSDLHRPSTANSTDKFKQKTGIHTVVTQLFQSRSKPPQPSSREQPQKDKTAKLPPLDDLIISSVFLCNDGKFRIYSSSVCDGLIDCPDSSDERADICSSSKTTAETKKCRSNEFQCPTGKCVRADSIKFSDQDCWKNDDSDEEKVNKNCSYPSLLCDNDKRCVSAKDRCNGVLDCTDKTDEMISPFSFVLSNLTFMCANGYCVSPNVRCNDFNDCGDNSDEISCDNHKIKKHQDLDDSCTEYTCPTGKCIQNKQVCNGHNDCEDNSDEFSCDDHENPSPQSLDNACPEYTCNSGMCISNNQVCDGDNDCGDDSDESVCDGSAFSWSQNRGLIIGLFILGGAVLVTIMAVIGVTMHYKRKYKNLVEETNRTDNHPPPYWQVVGVSVPDNLERTEQKTTDQVNIPYGGTTALPE